MIRYAVRIQSLALAVVATATASDVMAQPTVDVWLSSQDLKHRIEKQPSLSFARAESSELPAIEVDPARRYQSMLGLGASLEPTTCYNLSRLQPKAQDEVIRRLVDPSDGIGMNLMRICIGTPDFTGDPWYSYDDVPEGQTDETLAHFSIEKDRRYLLPILKKARAASPELRFFASPWSPPGWMTSTGDMIGGHLLPKYYGVYARYFVRFVQAYEKEDIPIHAVTIQNEPGVDRSKDRPRWRYPSCRWTGEQERDFIRDHLGPTFRKAGLKTKIWCYDHNFNEKPMPGDAGIDYPTVVLKDKAAATFVDGVAFHGYEGRPSGMGAFHERFPDVPIHFSEGSVFGAPGAVKLIEYFRNWACCYNAWVMMIDEKRGPNNGPFNASKTCIMLDSRTLEVSYRCDYYLYGQFMKFVRRGAVRVASSGSTRTFGNVAFLNPDGIIVLIVANGSLAAKQYRILSSGRSAIATLPAGAVATYVWRPE
ncbi:MAG: glycosyl hydrolase [Phycisphaerae bacterium]|nr:glycosyl hydrolase [Phycisphaerae bacterium]